MRLLLQIFEMVELCDLDCKLVSVTGIHNTVAVLLEKPFDRDPTKPGVITRRNKPPTLSVFLTNLVMTKQQPHVQDQDSKIVVDTVPRQDTISRLNMTDL